MREGNVKGMISDKVRKVARMLSMIVNVPVDVEAPANSYGYVFIFDRNPRAFVEVKGQETIVTPTRILLRDVLHSYVNLIINEMGEIDDDDERKSKQQG